MASMAKRACIVAFSMVLAGSVPAWAAVPESQRLERAKDLIAEEQWLRAIAELQAAAEDPKERDKDEALFWLAHSQKQTRQFAAALETLERLEKAHRKSRWVGPAQSLRVEIAQRLGRSDVLWFAARPPAPPAPPAAPRPRSARAPKPPAPPPVRPPDLPLPPSPPAVVTSTMPGAYTFWLSDSDAGNLDIRVQALGGLMHTEADKVIPLLKEIALDPENPGPARRALFVLAQSGRPEARSTVVEVARSGTEPVQIAAIRELGRLEGAGVATELMQVYFKANTAVRYQVVSALGDRAATTALLRIAQEEGDQQLRDAAVTTLGIAGGREQLTRLYGHAGNDLKRAIIAGYFNAKADDELIRVVRTERNATLRRDALTRLQVLGTPAARAFLETLEER